MKPVKLISAIALLFSAIALSACFYFDPGPSVSSAPFTAKIVAASLTNYSLQFFNLTAVISDPYSTTTTTWYRAESNLASGTTNYKGCVYAPEPTNLTYTVVVSSYSQTVTNSIQVTVIPYTNSDAAHLTFRNLSGMNLYKVLLIPHTGSLEPGDRPNLLSVPYLGTSNYTQVSNIVPGCYYWAYGENVMGTAVSGQYTIVPVAGSNYFDYHR